MIIMALDGPDGLGSWIVFAKVKLFFCRKQYGNLWRPFGGNLCLDLEQHWAGRTDRDVLVLLAVRTFNLVFAPVKMGPDQ